MTMGVELISLEQQQSGIADPVTMLLAADDGL